MKRTLTATLVASLAAPAFAGGPVIIEEKEEVVAVASTRSAIVPILLFMAIGLAVAGGGEDRRDRNSSDY